MKFLIAGLGNIGPEYELTRHNIGFMVIDRLRRELHATETRKRFRAEIAEAFVDGEKLVLMKPQTYMNESGRSIAEAARFMKLPLADIVVFHDELDLAVGKVRVKLGGGVAGHNGLRSADACLGSRDFGRVRIGIGHPGHKDRVTGHVLSDFHKVEQAWLEPLLDALADAAPLLARGSDAAFMSRVALLTQPPKPPKPPRPEAVVPPD